MHCSQTCVLQVISSIFSSGSQGFPPMPGNVFTLRLRCLVPPPQEHVHVLHMAHSPQAQSCLGHDEAIHGATSWRLPLKPAVQSPSPDACAMLSARTSMSDNLRSEAPNIISRLRSLRPVSHVAEHADQSDQSITAQGLVEVQAWVLHATVSVRTLRFPHVPPCSGCDWRCRFLYVWPPPHDLSQSAQADQSEISQSLGSSAWQPAVCFMASLQALPVPIAGISTSRVRYVCWGLAKLQPIQSVHWLKPQSCDWLTQRPSLHGIVFRMMPEQGCPPSRA
mmetsp:Transcript_32598/g.103394  ORF Transcript_32598/g.103394 Transcript_32598/m.103394 type:complete len:279 (-) Transcript_32598:646-1482(-)